MTYVAVDEGGARNRFSADLEQVIRKATEEARTPGVTMLICEIIGSVQVLNGKRFLVMKDGQND